MKALFLICTLFFLNSIFAVNVKYDHVLNTNGAFNIDLDDENKLDHALTLEEILLKKFTPSDVKVLKKVVNGREFELLIEKSIFGFVKKFTILGNIEVTRLSNGCLPNESAYSVFFDFSQSGADVTEAVAAFGLHICANLVNPQNVTIKTKNALYYRGRKYGFITEPIAKSVLNDQVNAFFNAVKLTIKELK